MECEFTAGWWWLSVVSLSVRVPVEWPPIVAVALPDELVRLHPGPLALRGEQRGQRTKAEGVGGEEEEEVDGVRPCEWRLRLCGCCAGCCWPSFCVAMKLPYSRFSVAGMGVTAVAYAASPSLPSDTATQPHSHTATQ